MALNLANYRLSSMVFFKWDSIGLVAYRMDISYKESYFMNMDLKSSLVTGSAETME